MCEDRRWKLFPNEDLASKVVFFYWRHPWLGEWSLNSMKPTSVDISKAPPSHNSKNETPDSKVLTALTIYILGCLVFHS